MRIAIPLSCLVALAPLSLPGFDKNGVAPRAISLPSGPGSIQGLGESFQPQLNNGSGSYNVPLVLPRGPGGQTPSLALNYNTGTRNGAIGLGWSIAGMPSIRRSTDRGVPLYVDGPNGLDDDSDGRTDNPEELDTFTGANQEELVRLDDGSFRAENEGAFWRYLRVGEGWEARSPDGDIFLFGQSSSARVESGGRVFEWCLEREVDRNDNAIEYEYQSDPVTPARKFPRRVRWGRGPQAYLAAVFLYESGRPDVSSSYQTGFDLRTSLRLSGIDLISHGIAAPALALRADLDGDGQSDALIRRYRLEYDPQSHLSLLARVTLRGADGATALPTLKLGYSQWTPLDDAAAAIIRSIGAPAAGPESPSVELIDMNGDGLPDLLSTAGSQHRVALNLGVDASGRLAWGPSQPVGNAPQIDLASDLTHLADATADGAADLLLKITNTSFLCYDNTSLISWSPDPFFVRNTDTWPIWPYDGAGGKLSRSFDSDYSRTNDILHTSESGNRLWLLLPGGRYSKELRMAPLLDGGQVFRFDLPGTHIADLNGDRLLDLAWIQASRVVYFPSRGRGDFAEPIVLGLGMTLTVEEIQRADFSDVDGDGLQDLTVVRPAFLATGVAYWLNRFDGGLEGPRRLTGLPALHAGDGLRWADMNGNGTTDVVISLAQSAPGEKIAVIDLIPEGKIHLLERVENGLGLQMDFEYESSTVQMVRARAAGAPWTSVMPIHVTVVSRIAEDDGRGQVHRQAITYRDPHYDPVKQEFRGFQTAEALEEGDDSAAGKVVRHTFDTGRGTTCMKGKLLAEEVRGEDGTLFNRTERSYAPRVLASGQDGREVCFAPEEATDQFTYEGAAEAVRLRSELDHDDFGNVTAEKKLGIAGQPGDEVFTRRSYEVRTDRWLLRLLAQEITGDAGGNRLAELRHSYDARGNRLKTEAWLDLEDRFIPDLRQAFDAFGNVIESTDARGNLTEIDYDGVLHAWPILETIHLEGRDLHRSAEYDLGFGVVTASRELSGEAMAYTYDALGRLTVMERPGGAEESYQYTFGNPVSRVVKRIRIEPGGDTFDAYLYSDAYGRPLATQVEAEGGKWRFLEGKSYNAQKLVANSWLPFFTGTPEYAPPDPSLPHEETTYDAMGRPLETRKADGSVSRLEYGPLSVSSYDGNDTAGGGAPDVRCMDGLGRIIGIEERNGADTYFTRYEWNARGELEGVVDAQGNRKRWRFDSLGRLREVDDPDRGLWKYGHDDAGNRTHRTDGRNQVIATTYDAANRTLARVWVGAGAGGVDIVEAAYHYDEPAGELDFGDGTRGTARNLEGRLAWIKDRSGEEHFSYDERGNIEWALKRIRDEKTGLLVGYRTRRAYDLLNRETEVIFPDNDRLRTLRGAGAFVERIDGGPGAGAILEEAEYLATGQPLRLRFANGAESTFTYDSAQRLLTHRTASAGGSRLLDQQLSYDRAANVIEVLDQRPLAEVPADSPRRRTARCAYDDLHRLTRVRYGVETGAPRLDFAYDALGNLVAQSSPPPGQAGHLADAGVDLGAVAYQGGRAGRSGRRPRDPPGPHAATGTGNGHRFGYDADGNMTSYDSAALGWDPQARLERWSEGGAEARYALDHAGRRVAKVFRRGAARQESSYPDPDFEVEDDAPVKYAMIDSRRIARIRGMLDPSRDRVQRLLLASGWNLLAVAVESSATLADVFGPDAAVYEARGGSYGPVDTSRRVPVGRALWVHAPAARLAVLRGPYAGSAADIVSSGPLHAWPLLEPFRPESHTGGRESLLVYNAGDRSWARRDPSLPSFLNDAPEELGAARAFWSEGTVALKPSAAARESTVFFHQDHLDSTAALTDARGDLAEERTHYPFGGIRSRFRPGATAGSTRFDFTGKERDAESGLTVMGARCYLDLVGQFLSPDPRYAEAADLADGKPRDKQSFAAYLANPQLGNLYAYAARNPLKFIDPSGLEVVFTEEVMRSAEFRKALNLFAQTEEGNRILGSLNRSNVKVYVVNGRPISAKTSQEVYGQTRSGVKFSGRTPMVTNGISINLSMALKDFKDITTKDQLTIVLANLLHHELRHAEGNANSYSDSISLQRSAFSVVNQARRNMGLNPVPMPAVLRRGEEVHGPLDSQANDPLQEKFDNEVRKIVYPHITRNN
jgi:RHS repeat-associated protein